MALVGTLYFGLEKGEVGKGLGCASDEPAALEDSNGGGSMADGNGWAVASFGGFKKSAGSGVSCGRMDPGPSDGG